MLGINESNESRGAMHRQPGFLVVLPAVIVVVDYAPNLFIRTLWERVDPSGEKFQDITSDGFVKRRDGMREDIGDCLWGERLL